MNYPIIILNPGKEKALKNFHQWIFSGAIDKSDDFQDGDILEVQSSKGEFLAYGYFNKRNSLAGRIISFEKKDPLIVIENNIRKALSLRKDFFDEKITNAYRLINAEADNLPGLIVDKYNEVLVLQITTLGMEKLKNHIISILKKESGIQTFYEKSSAPSRREEGLSDFQGLLFGEDVSEVEILENKMKFIVDIKNSQKTGFYLDQREMRDFIRKFSKGKKVLNCFSYSGGFTLAALYGKAKYVHSVEISDTALSLLQRNLLLNDFDDKNNSCYKEDVFKFLRAQDLTEYDLIILDPPAFVKRKSELYQAMRGYKDINLQVFKKVKPGTLVLTSSCSHYVDEKTFQMLIFEAAKDAKRNVKILQKHHLAFDHPINIYHPEGEYLKSLFLQIE